MNGDSFFEERIDTLLRWRKRRRLFSLIVWFLALSLILNAVALGFQKIFYSLGAGISIYLALTLLSFGLSLLLHRLTRKDFLSELIAIDSRLQLKERLSTAFEYRQSERKSRFREGLLTDAGRVLEELPKTKLYPLGFSAAYILIPLFAFILLGLSFFDFSPLKPSGKKTQERLARAGKAIERFSKEKIRETIGLNDQSLGEPYRQLEEIARDLQSRSMKPEKLLLTLGEMKKEALAERLRLTRKLEKDLSADGSPGPANPFTLPQELTTSKDLEKLTEQLKDLFEDGLPESIAKDISRIGEKLDLEQFLDKTINQAIPSEPTGDERSFLSKRGKGNSGEGEPRENSGKQSFGEARSFLALEKEQTKLPMPPTPGKGAEEERKAGKRPQGRDDDDGFTAGTTKGTGERLLPSELKGGKGPSFKEGGGPSGREPGSSFQVRALPLYGNKKNGREEIVPEVPPSYRREMEAALLKEKIPQEYREYIKHYFLSIRQEKGKKQDDKNQ